jgi:CubicO group peptidase (beta-lactamase class C family)
MRRIPVLVLMTFLLCPVMAQTNQDTVNMINNMFSRYLPENPGGQLSISRNGKLIFSKAWGLADIENKTPYTTETVTEAGSISKQFTAACILLLEQQGKLALTDNVRTYIPELPDYGSPITIQNLMHHTSGLREWSSLVAMSGWPRTTRVYRNEDILSLICRQAKLNNKPGAEFIYSNANYLLMAVIVERVTGKTFPEFATEYILKPAGMVHSGWRDSYRKIVLNRGIAYSKKGDHYEINMPFESVYGPGALITTTEDLLKWTDFYWSGKFGSPSLLQKQLHIEPLTSGAETIYAAGLFINKTRGLTKVFHDGQTASYTGIVESFPQINLSIAWLSNTTEFKDSLLTGVHALERFFIIDSTKAMQEQAVIPAPVSAAVKNGCAGWYGDDRTYQGIKINLVHDTLFFDNTPLIPIEKTTYRFGASTIHFENREGFIMATADKRKLMFSKKEEVAANSNYLKSFTGKYYSTETKSGFEIIFKEGKLYMEDDYLKDVLLTPTYKNAFNLFFDVDGYLHPQAAYMLFKRNAKEKISQCLLSTYDARGISFTKLP